MDRTKRLNRVARTVYNTPPQNLADLRQKIIDGCRSISVETFGRVREAIKHRHLSEGTRRTFRTTAALIIKQKWEFRYESENVARVAPILQQMRWPFKVDSPTFGGQIGDDRFGKQSANTSTSKERQIDREIAAVRILYLYFYNTGTIGVHIFKAYEALHKIP
ncbi:hypothetical protein NQ318_021648 [Aromia moschata]|uniref:Ribosomal protein S7 n=1 Tax=Aromia moschata TaxID=1265417 RepID=A0AAV8XT19_9CUCU|nr:hypothetical protein NQ318_021648 [Aromia moschata]